MHGHMNVKLFTLLILSHDRIFTVLAIAHKVMPLVVYG